MERYVRARYRSLDDSIDEEYDPHEADEIKKEILRTGRSSRTGLRNIRDYQCDGAILHVLLSCRSQSSGLQLTQQRMLDLYKVPSLVIEGDIIDTSLFNPAEAIKKAEAFEETMEHYRQVRKELGMAW